MIRHRLNSILEDLVGASHEVLLGDTWEAGAVSQALSVCVLFTVLGNMVSMSVWHHDIIKAGSLAGSVRGISILIASVEAEAVAPVNHESEADVKVRKG